MLGLSRKSKHFVLCGGESEAVLASVHLPAKGAPKVRVLASATRENREDIDIAGLVAGAGRKKGKVALVLPLHRFELASVTVPPVDRKSASKLLPYNLSRVLDGAVTEYVYDWQVAQKFKDRHELTVYLFSSVMFDQYRQELLSRQKEIAWFEPDVFAACSYLSSKRIGIDTTFLCILIWEKSVSIAVFENEKVSVVRSVDFVKPSGAPGSTLESEPSSVAEDSDVSAEAVEVEKGDTIDQLIEGIVFDDLVEEKEIEFIEPPSEFLSDKPLVIDRETPERKPVNASESFFVEKDDSDGILAGFGLQEMSTESSVDMVDTHGVVDIDDGNMANDFHFFEPESKPEEQLWTQYLQNINLEIMRTCDYHTSVLKGKAVQEIFIGGAEQFFERVESMILDGQDTKVSRFPVEEIDSECSKMIAALCIGALQR